MIKLAKDIAKDLRKDLKEELGLNRNHVSVTTASQSIIVKLKVDTDIEAVEDFTRSYEVYERDEATGEILQGGNTFIFVEEA
ncbi:hypothetical protein [Staphylococcus saprophyticus]|uniref:hypothetical protein n=1 Tax=Staphylococcus saprophyticus TaxID=29385 RepID=UPI0034C6CCA4